MSINAISSTNNSYANHVNYTAAPVAFRANNSTPQTKPMSTETKCLIGGGVIAGTAALVIGAKKGLFGTNIKNKINELFKKFGGDAKAKAEQEAKLKAEQEAKAKAEKEAQEEARTASSSSNKPSNNTGSATTSSSSHSSGTSNSGSGSSTRRSSGRRNSGGHYGTSHSTNNSAGSSNNVNPTGTSAKPNGTPTPTPTAQPKTQNNAAAPNVNPQPIVAPKAQGTVQPKPQPANPQPTAQPKPQPANPQPAAQPKPKVTQPPKEIFDKINEINAAYADALKDQPISFIKTFENGEIITTASVKTEQLIETMLSEVPANVPETIKQELKTALEKELEKLKLVRTGNVDDEKMMEEFSSKFSDFFENIDNNPVLSSIKKKSEQWEKQIQEEAKHILQGIERDTAEAKEAQRRIDIAQEVHTAPVTVRFSNKSAEESANVFSEAMRKENRNAKCMVQNAYDEAVTGRLEHITSEEDAKKYMMQKIEKYVQDCGTFKKVNKNVEINGERVNIIYEGVDVDITSEGKLLKKVFVPKTQKAPEMQYENLSKRLADQIEADAEYARRQAQRQRQAQQQRRMLHA